MINHYFDNLEITTAEVEVIEYLKAYKTVEGTIYKNENDLT